MVKLLFYLRKFEIVTALILCSILWSGSVMAKSKTKIVSLEQADVNKDTTKKQILTEKINLIAIEKNAQTILSTLTPEEKIGHLFIWSFDGKTPNKKIDDLISNYHINSFIVFKKNLGTAKEIQTLTGYIKGKSILINKVPPLISLDQEGGLVSRLPLDIPYPSPLSIGQTEHPELAKIIGNETGEILKTLGFNMNLAPVLDSADPYAETFVSTRSYGANIDNVSRMGVNYSRSMIDSGVMPTAKHFPGIGMFIDDPHKKIIKTKISKEQLANNSLLPFKDFIKLGEISAIMMSHHVFESIDSQPASLSSVLISDLLRDELKYNGIIMTDDLMMGGASSVVPAEEASLQALKAGADLIMIAWSEKSQFSSYKRVLSALQNNEISMKEVDTKVLRLLKTKLALETIKPDLKSSKSFQLSKNISSPIIEKVSNSILNFNSGVEIKKHWLVNGKRPEKLPPLPEKLCLVSKNIQFLSEFKSVYKNPVLFFHDPEKIDSKSKACDFSLLHISSESSVSLIKKALKLNSFKNAVIVNTTAPYLAKEFEKDHRVLNLFFLYKNTSQRLIELIPIIKSSVNKRSIANEKSL